MRKTCWYSNFSTTYVGNFQFSPLGKRFQLQMTNLPTNFPLLLSATFCFHFWQKKIYKSRVFKRKKKGVCSENLWTHDFIIFFFFINAGFVKMKRLKSFFLSRSIVLVESNKKHLSQKATCAENEVWTKHFLLCHFSAKNCCLIENTRFFICKSCLFENVGFEH